MAAQYYHIVCLLLVSCNPELPRFGLMRRQEEREVKSEIRRRVKDISGIALCHPRIESALLVASLVVALWGDHFTEFNEQLTLLDVLVKTQMELAWPTATVQEALKATWGRPSILTL